ncbi:MAG: hypothetical protein AAF721_13880 [Myxococcota bacterium]
MEPPGLLSHHSAPVLFESDARADATTVLVPYGTRLFFAPTGDGGVVPRDRYAEHRKAGQPSLFMLRAGDRVGDRLRVYTTGAPYDTCASGDTWDGSREFTFYIEPDALQRVTSRPITHDYRDGSRVKLAAGVPVSTDDAGKRVAFANELAIRVPLPASAVSTTYQPSASFTDDSGYDFVPKGEHIRFGRGQRAPAERFHGSLGGAGVSERKKGQSRVTVRASCVEIRGRASRVETFIPPSGPPQAIPQQARNFDPDCIAAALEYAEPIGDAVALDVDCSLPDVALDMRPPEPSLADVVKDALTPPEPTPARRVIEAGAPLYWESGELAGVVRHADYLEPATDAVGERLCFVDDLGFELRATVCVDAFEVRDAGRWWGGKGFVAPKAPPRAQVFRGPTTIIGVPDLRGVRRAFASATADLERCFQQTLDEGSREGGDVTVFVSAGEASPVVNIVADDFDEPATVACMREALTHVAVGLEPGARVEQVLQLSLARPD